MLDRRARLYIESFAERIKYHFAALRSEWGDLVIAADQLAEQETSFLLNFRGLHATKTGLVTA